MYTPFPPQASLIQYFQVENVGLYRQGGFHPVHIDDVLQSRYQVLNKLGYGSYGTAWLVEDLTSGRLASLKILASDVSTNSEAGILRHLEQHNPSNFVQDGRQFVVKLLDDFKIEGPNGTHQCIVTEVLGPSLTSGTELVYGEERFPIGVAKRLVSEVLRGVEFLHSKGVIHGGKSPCLPEQ